MEPLGRAARMASADRVDTLCQSPGVVNACQSCSQDRGSTFGVDLSGAGGKMLIRCDSPERSPTAPAQSRTPRNPPKDRGVLTIPR
jgi:hypothetical protein